MVLLKQNISGSEKGKKSNTESCFIKQQKFDLFLKAKGKAKVQLTSVVLGNVKKIVHKELRIAEKRQNTWRQNELSDIFRMMQQFSGKAGKAPCSLDTCACLTVWLYSMSW